MIACVLLPLVEISMRVLGLPPTLAWLRATASSRRATGLEPRLFRTAVDRASRHGLVAGRCLSQSLTLWWLLTNAGLGSRLRLGVTIGEQGFDAHAWVENDHGVINDSQDVSRRYPASFVPLG